MIPANDNQTRTFISMFSGIEAASVAFGPLGWKPICFAEIEKFPSAVLAHHYPDVPNVGDMSQHDWSQYRGKVDVVCGGPPCQAFSVAGLRNSMADARGNLSIVYMRALHAIKPRNAIVENVPGWLSTKDNAFGCFLAGLVGASDALPPPPGGKWPSAGMVSGPKGRAAWRIQDAQFHGLAQRRRRVLVVADFGDGADPAAVLFERYGVQGNSPPSREKGKGFAGAVAPSLVSSGRGVERTGDTRGQDPVVAVLRGHSDYGDGSPTLRAKGGDCAGGSEALVFASEIAPTMRAGGNKTGGDRPPGTDVDTADSLIAVCVTGEIAHTLKAEGADASEDGTGRGTPIITFSQQMSVPQCDFDMTQTLQAKNQQAAYIHPAVRRLTPVECERLQGFDDKYTEIPWRGKPAEECPDGPRYKALGNSWAVPKFAWLGKRIQLLMPSNDNHKRSEENNLAA